MGATDDDRMRWAEALAIERMHGDDAPRWIAERIGSLARAGDVDGVDRFRQIAARFEGLLSARRSATPS